MDIEPSRRYITHMNKTFKAFNPATDTYITFSIVPSLPPFEARALAIEVARTLGCSGVKAVLS